MIAPGASYQGLPLSRHIPLPSFLSAAFLPARRPNGRATAVTVATAGVLSLAAVVSAVAVTAPPAPSRPSVATDTAFLTTAGGQSAGQAEQRTVSNSYQEILLFDKARAAATVRVRQAAAAQAAARAAAAQAAAAKAAAQRAHAARARAAAVSAPAGSPQLVAERMLGQFGWPAGQFSCLQPLWGHESGWSMTARNPSSGAYGIAQALPAAQMASAGPDWQTSAATQVKWGLTYIKDRYGSPCGAWAHEQASSWY